jgi:hypothetical protein
LKERGKVGQKGEEGENKRHNRLHQKPKSVLRRPTGKHWLLALAFGGCFLEEQKNDQKKNRKAKKMKQTFVFEDVEGFVWFADIENEDTRVLTRDLNEAFIRAERDGRDVLSTADEGLELGRRLFVSEIPKSSYPILRSREEKRPTLWGVDAPCGLDRGSVCETSA